MSPYDKFKKIPEPLLERIMSDEAQEAIERIQRIEQDDFATVFQALVDEDICFVSEKGVVFVTVELMHLLNK